MYIPKSPTIIITLFTITTALASSPLAGQYPLHIYHCLPCKSKLTFAIVEREANAAPAEEARAGSTLWRRFDGFEGLFGRAPSEEGIIMTHLGKRCCGPGVTNCPCGHPPTPCC